MRSSFLLLVSFLLDVCGVQGASDFRVCAFNLHHFGDSKTKKSEVMQTLVRVRQRQFDCDTLICHHFLKEADVFIYSPVSFSPQITV